MSEDKLGHPLLDLRSLTAARVSLPMSGHSLTTGEVLELQQAHARARDAVHATFSAEQFARTLSEDLRVLTGSGVEILAMRSCAADRASYLRNPQLGRTLAGDSAERLQRTPCDLAITIADGLSSLAVQTNAFALLKSLLPQLAALGWTLAPITIVEQGRVAICDAIGERLGAGCSLMLIGERPGLSGADSMGAYLTWNPRAGRTDADRNCLSNIRSGGTSVEEAAHRLMDLLTAARARGLTGVSLKEGANSLLQP